MKEKIITTILEKMLDSLGSNQIEQLKTVMYIVLKNHTIIENPTEVACIDNSYMQYLNLFLARKKIEGKSEKTIELYYYHLSRLLCLLNKPLDKISENDLFCYLTMYKKDRNVSNVYLDNMRLVCSTFFGWLHSKGYISFNPASGLEPIKKEKRIKSPFTDEELEKLRRTCETKRDLALLEFLYSTGVRVSEAVMLNRQDIDFAEKNVVVYGKGNKERETYLSPTSCMYLKEYLNFRSDNNEALFVTLYAPFERLSAAGMEEAVRRLGKQAGVEKVHPHRFRRTMATNILRKGMPVEEVKELLGHEKLDTTMIYCNVSRDNVRHSHQKYM